MANWYGSSRTNYFRVKDADAFRRAMEQFEVDVWNKEGDATLFGLGANTEDGGWPSYDMETDEDFDFADKVSPHLAEGEICVMQTIGAEKLRYLSGFATAINHLGERVDVSIRDIYQLAKDKFKVEHITEATY